MVNKKFCFGMLVMVLVFGMSVVGCNDDAQIVAFEYAESPGWVTVEIYSDYNIVVYFNTVKSAVSYDIYVQVEGAADIKHLSTVQAEGNNGSERTGAYNFTKSQIGVGGRCRFGVTATDIDKNKVPSKIVWSDYITSPGLPDTPVQAQPEENP